MTDCGPLDEKRRERLFTVPDVDETPAEKLDRLERGRERAKDNPAVILPEDDPVAQAHGGQLRGDMRETLRKLREEVGQ